MDKFTACACGTKLKNARYGKPRRYCEKCRPSKYAPVPKDRTCTQCGSSFLGKVSALYCSASCNQTARLLKGAPCDVCGDPTTSFRPNSRGFYRHMACLSPTEHGTRQGYRERKCKCGACVQWNRDQVRAYKEKRQNEGRPLKTTGGSGPWISPALRESVFERDGWSCQLCGEVLDRNADPQSDWYPSLDHIVPQSQGGAHTFENLRAAHRWCNCVRGDDRFHQDLFV